MPYPLAPVDVSTTASPGDTADATGRLSAMSAIPVPFTWTHGNDPQLISTRPSNSPARPPAKFAARTPAPSGESVKPTNPCEGPEVANARPKTPAANALDPMPVPSTAPRTPNTRESAATALPLDRPSTPPTSEKLSPSACPSLSLEQRRPSRRTQVHPRWSDPRRRQHASPAQP